MPNELSGFNHISLAELQQFSALIGADVYQVLTLEGSLSSRNHIGGTAPRQVAAAIARAPISLRAYFSRF